MINDISEDEENAYWIGTSQGLILLKGLTAKIFKHDISAPQGLLDNWVIDIFCDSKGHIWIGTSKGLSKISKNENDASITILKKMVSPTHLFMVFWNLMTIIYGSAAITV